MTTDMQNAAKDMIQIAAYLFAKILRGLTYKAAFAGRDTRASPKTHRQANEVECSFGQSLQQLGTRV